MSEINELLQKRAELVKQARDISEKAVKEKRSMTSEEDTTFNKMIAEVNGLDKTIEAAKQARTLERNAAEIAANNPGNSGDSAADARTKAFRSFLLNGTAHMPEGERRALQADMADAGGFLAAPQQFVKMVIKNVDDLLFIRQKATVYPVTNTESLGVPTMTANPDDADWTAEIANVNEDAAMKFGKRELKPKPLSKLLKVSRQLMRVSGIPVDEFIAGRLAYKTALPQEKGFLTGTGANQALGLFTASNDGIPTTRDFSTGNTATEIRFDGLIEAKYGLKAQYQRVAEWIFHRDAVKQIAKLKDGEGQYIWQPSKVDGEPDRLLGNALNISEYAPNTFTTGLYVGLIGDLSWYWIAEAVSFELQRLDELYAATNQVGFIARAQVDGMPVLAEAFSRVKLG